MRGVLCMKITVDVEWQPGREKMLIRQVRERIAAALAFLGGAAVVAAGVRCGGMSVAEFLEDERRRAAEEN